MESYGGTFIEPLGGIPDVAPHFNRLTEEGVFFTNCYANSFGLTAVLSVPSVDIWDFRRPRS